MSDESGRGGARYTLHDRRMIRLLLSLRHAVLPILVFSHSSTSSSGQNEDMQAQGQYELSSENESRTSLQKMLITNYRAVRHQIQKKG